jgi:hypothetical protein
MNADDRAHWLEPSRPIAVDGDERPARQRPLRDADASDEAPASEDPPARQGDDDGARRA